MKFTTYDGFWKFPIMALLAGSKQLGDNRFMGRLWANGKVTCKKMELHVSTSGAYPRGGAKWAIAPPLGLMLKKKSTVKIHKM